LGDDVIKITAKHTPIMTSTTKNTKPKLKEFFIQNDETSRVLRGFEQLTSSVCCRVMPVKVWPEMANDTFCVTLLFLWKTGLLRHNFGSRSAKKSIKIQKDADFSLVSNKT